MCATHPLSPCGHSRLGPITMAMLLGDILFSSDFSHSFARNFTKYLKHNEKQ